MTRAELIKNLSAHFSQLTPGDVALSIATILDTIGNRLAEGGRTEIRGFGSFKVNVRPPRNGRNPKTGEQVAVPAKPTLHFKPAVEMRQRVKEQHAG